MSAFNIEAYLNSLPDDIEEINVFYKELSYLPDLSRFTNLKYLYCSHNKLVFLPLLPNSLKYLNCSHNQLVSLPLLPNSLDELECSGNCLGSLPLLPNLLRELFCNFNKLSSLPLLPDSLQEIWCLGNPIYNIINSDNVNIVKEKVKNLNKFRLLYYCIKYKNKFRKWLWDIREKKAIEKYNPKYLIENLVSEDIDLDTVLDKW